LLLQRAQRQQKETEKQLRNNVKWMMADSETWLKSLEQRLHQLDRVRRININSSSFVVVVVKWREGLGERRGGRLRRIDVFCCQS